MCNQLSVSSIVQGGRGKRLFLTSGTHIAYDNWIRYSPLTDVQAIIKNLSVVTDALPNDSFLVTSSLQEGYGVNGSAGQALVNLIDKGGYLINS